MKRASGFGHSVLAPALFSTLKPDSQSPKPGV